jgi:hypothetical protein
MIVSDILDIPNHAPHSVNKKYKKMTYKFTKITYSAGDMFSPLSKVGPVNDS